MPTHCKPVVPWPDFTSVIQGRRVTAAFDGGSITSERRGAAAREGGPLHRGSSTRVEVGMLHRPPRSPSDGAFGAHDWWRSASSRAFPWDTKTYNDHDRLATTIPCWRCFPARLEARRKDCFATWTGKSTLSRLEHAPAGGKPSTGYAKIDHDPEKLQDVLIESFNSDSWHGAASYHELVLDIDSTDDEVHGTPGGPVLPLATTTTTACRCRCTITCGGRPLFALLRPGSADPAERA